MNNQISINKVINYSVYITVHFRAIEHHTAIKHDDLLCMYVEITSWYTVSRGKIFVKCATLFKKEQSKSLCLNLYMHKETVEAHLRNL